MATESVSFSSLIGNPANFFVAAIYDQGTLLESQQVPRGGGYPVPPATFQVSFVTVLTQGKTYRVILWESADATPTGQSRVSGDLAASTNSVSMRGDLSLTGGVTAGMNIGASGYVDPTNSLAGWNYSIELFGSGTIDPGVNYTVDPVTGNWTLIDGTTIRDGQKYVLHFQAQISQAAPPPVSLISSGRIITVNTTLASTDKNKALWVQGAGSNLTVTLPALSTLADYDMLVIYSTGGGHINAVFPTQGTDKIQYNGLRTQLILGQGEALKLIKANGVYNVDNGPLIGVDRVGEIIYKYTYSIGPSGSLVFDGDPNIRLLDGTLYPRADLARSFDYANTRVDATGKVSEATWNSHQQTKDGLSYFDLKAKWTLGTDGTNFRFPLLLNQFIRILQPGVRNPGDFQFDALASHAHDTLIGNINTSPNGFGPSKAGGKYGDPRTGVTDLTSPPFKAPGAGNAGALLQRADFETRPINISLYAAIRI